MKSAKNSLIKFFWMFTATFVLAQDINKEKLNLYKELPNSLKSKVYGKTADSRISHFLYFACQNGNEFYAMESTSYRIQKEYTKYLFLKFYSDKINDKFFPIEELRLKFKKGINKDINDISNSIKNKDYSEAFTKINNFIEILRPEEKILYLTEGFAAYDENEDGLIKKVYKSQKEYQRDSQDKIISRKLVKYNKIDKLKDYSFYLELCSYPQNVGLSEKEIKLHKSKLDNIINTLHKSLKNY